MKSSVKNNPLLFFLVRCFEVIVIGWCIFSLYKIIITFAPDFSVFWIAGYNLIHHRNPYTDPHLFTMNAYPPFTFIFFIPFGLLPYSIAQGVFILLSFFSIIGSVFVSIKILTNKVNINHFLLILSLTLLSFPTKFTLGMGQINAVAFFFCISAYYFYKNKRPEIAGILLGLSFLLKPTLGFLLLFFVVKRKWKIIFYAALFSLFTAVLVTLLFGTGVFIYWFNYIVPHLSGISGAEVYYNQGIMGFISRLSINANVRTYGTIVLSLPLVLYPMYLSLRTKNENLLFSLFIIILLLVDKFSFQHHFIWLLFPYITLSNYIKKLKNVRLWILLGISYILVSWNFKNPSQLINFPYSLILSNTFYGCVIMYVLTINQLEK